MVKKVTINNSLEPFLTRPNEKLHLAEISRLLNEPHPTVRQWLNSLEKKGVLRRDYKGRLTLFSLNMNNPNILNYLIISEKNKLVRYCEKRVILAELVRHIEKNFNDNVDALIFGSAADSFNSANDIDLLVVGKQNVRDIKRYATRLNKDMHIIQVNNLKKITASLKTEIIKKHLIIKGSEDLVRWMVWQQ